jgi:hypothetical protein
MRPDGQATTDRTPTVFKERGPLKGNLRDREDLVLIVCQ